jgi:hypothetical protein
MASTIDYGVRPPCLDAETLNGGVMLPMLSTLSTRPTDPYYYTDLISDLKKKKTGRG